MYIFRSSQFVFSDFSLSKNCDERSAKEGPSLSQNRHERSAKGGPPWAKTVTNAGPKQAFRCLDFVKHKG